MDPNPVELGTLNKEDLGSLLLYSFVHSLPSLSPKLLLWISNKGFSKINTCTEEYNRKSPVYIIENYRIFRGGEWASKNEDWFGFCRAWQHSWACMPFAKACGVWAGSRSMGTGFQHSVSTATGAGLKHWRTHFSQNPRVGVKSRLGDRSELQGRQLGLHGSGHNWRRGFLKEQWTRKTHFALVIPSHTPWILSW